MQIEEAIREMKEKEEQEVEKKQLSWKQKAMGVVLPTESELAEAQDIAKMPLIWYSEDEIHRELS